jgi:hypothetical protein
MKQSNFSLADLLNLLTALSFGFICFLGENFITLGNTYISIVWATIITITLSGTAFLAKFFKRTSRNFKNSFILEIIVILLFTSLTVFFSYSSFSHYFNVSDKKEEIQKKLQTSITQVENMFTEYEQYAENRKLFYKNQLNGIVAAKQIRPNDYANCGFEIGIVSDDKQISNKMFTIHTLLFPTNYSDSVSNKGLKEVATEWLLKAKNRTNNWKPGIVNVVNEIDKNSEDWKSQLIGFSQQVNLNCHQYQSFSYQTPFTDLKKYFSSPSKPTLLTISLAVVAYLLMLMSWFITKRHSRSTGILTRAPYEIVL